MSRTLLRRVTSVLIVSLLLSVPATAFAQSATNGAEARRSSPVKRALLTIAGAGVGLTAGLWLGLSTFDDAINSERKVLTSMVVGAVAGGAAGYAMSTDQARPSTTRREPDEADFERLVEVGLQIFEGAAYEVNAGGLIISNGVESPVGSRACPAPYQLAGCDLFEVGSPCNDRINHSYPLAIRPMRKHQSKRQQPAQVRN